MLTFYCITDRMIGKTVCLHKVMLIDKKTAVIIRSTYNL